MRAASRSHSPFTTAAPVLGALCGLCVIAVGAVGAIDVSAPAIEHELTLGVPGRSNATPSMVADGRFVAIAWGATAPDGKTDVFIATSRNGGLTFGSPVQVNAQRGDAHLGGELPPRVVILKTQSYGGPDVAVLWTARGASTSTSILIARSPNGGRSFEQPVALQSAGAPGDRGWPSMTVDDRGIAHAIWLDHREQPSGLYHASVPAEAGTVAAVPATEREIAKSVCYCCKTSLVAGRDGALYAAWRHVYPGSVRDIAFSVSRDGGKTFSEPVPISRDNWAIDACPDDGPALAVDGSQTVHVVWPSVIGAAGTDPQGALFYTSTGDGRRFAARTRIPTLGGTKASHPQIAIDHTGRVFVAWDESIDGTLVAALREIKPGTRPGTNPGSKPGTRTAPTFGPPVTLSVRDPGTYPVIAATSDSLIAAWTSVGAAAVAGTTTGAAPAAAAAGAGALGSRTTISIARVRLDAAPAAASDR